MLEFLPLIFSVGSTLLSMKGQQQQAKAQVQASNTAAVNDMAAANFEAQQADYLANQALAVSHREAYEQRKASALLASKALANAAGSGAGASDPTVVKLIKDIQDEGTYRSALALYEGIETSRSYNVAAQARRLGGTSAAAARVSESNSMAKTSNMSMFSTLLSGSSSFIKNYSELF